MTVRDAWLPYEEEHVCHVSYASMKEGIFALKGLCAKYSGPGAGGGRAHLGHHTPGLCPR